jgi:hypothetical protein
MAASRRRLGSFVLWPLFPFGKPRHLPLRNSHQTDARLLHSRLVRQLRDEQTQLRWCRQWPHSPESESSSDEAKLPPRACSSSTPPLIRPVQKPANERSISGIVQNAAPAATHPELSEWRHKHASTGRTVRPSRSRQMQVPTQITLASHGTWSTTQLLLCVETLTGVDDPWTSLAACQTPAQQRVVLFLRVDSIRSAAASYAAIVS